ncbi:TadE/TadG family type IV pilus assembly protein [Photobacterium sp. DNB23_23_1]|uniref:Pilus assembly protein n=1 Tax=Photobacterium pectinilyticum TaxID=2906793 RepID=A0ABT1N2B6_9GAMM|nr:TadE/TadG family type IV pilus assembly protein [Photobacterium sp. ZSDE20]MCQ1058868.1 pilus assembly protein [Photobacterium sp. ZSDE20]MDD1823842.1 pilus assembly protein [Photobacterium sp. ZSDE20]
MRFISRHRGVAIVEFTILLPFFLFLLFTIAEMGRAFYTYAELEKLSRESARYLSGELIKGSTGLYSISDSDKILAKNLAVYGSVDGGSSSSLPGLDTSHLQVSLNGNYVKVEISYPYQPVLAVIPGFFVTDDIDMNITLVSSYSMRVL